MLQSLLGLALSGPANLSPATLFLDILPALFPLIGLFVAPALPSILDTEVTDILPKLYLYFSPTDKTPTLTAPTLAIATPTYTQEVSHVAIYAVLACIALSLFGSSLVIGKIEQQTPPPPSAPPPPPPSSSLSSPATQLPNPTDIDEHDGSPPPPPPPPIFTTPMTDPRVPHKAFLAWVVLLLVVVASAFATLKQYPVLWGEAWTWLRRTFQWPFQWPSVVPVVVPADGVDIHTAPTSPPVPSPQVLLADNISNVLVYAPALSPPLPPLPPVQQHIVLPSPPSFLPDVDARVRVGIVVAGLVVLSVKVVEIRSAREVDDDNNRIEDAEVESAPAPAESAMCSSPLPPAPSPRALISDRTNALVLYSPPLPPAPSPRELIGYTTNILVSPSFRFPFAPSARELLGDATNALVLYSPPLPPTPSPRAPRGDSTNFLALYSPPFSPFLERQHLILPSYSPSLSKADNWRRMKAAAERALLLLMTGERGMHGTVHGMIRMKEAANEPVEASSAFIQEDEGEAALLPSTSDCMPSVLAPAEIPAVVFDPHFPVLTPSTEVPISTPVVPSTAESAMGPNSEGACSSVIPAPQPTSQPLNVVATSVPGLQPSASIPGLPCKPMSATQISPGSNFHSLPPRPWWIPSDTPRASRSAPGLRPDNSALGLPPRPNWVTVDTPAAPFIPTPARSGPAYGFSAPAVGPPPRLSYAIPIIAPPPVAPAPAKPAPRLNYSVLSRRLCQTPDCITLTVPVVGPAPVRSSCTPGSNALNANAVPFIPTAPKPAAGLNPRVSASPCK